MDLIHKNILFKECVESLQPNVKILSKEKSEILWKSFRSQFPITYWGRINWDILYKKTTIASLDEIIPLLRTSLKQVNDNLLYILWNDSELPVIKTSLQEVLEHFDDIVCVAPDTWIWAPGYIIEAFHDGEIVVSLLPSSIRIPN